MIQKCEQRAAGFSDLVVRDRTGVKRQFSRPSQDLDRDRLLVSGRESLESVEEFDRLLAHMFKLAVFPTGSNGALLWPEARRIQPLSDVRLREAVSLAFDLTNNR